MRCVRICVPLVLLLLAAPRLQAQSPSASPSSAVPRVVRLTGTFVPANGLAPAPVETVTLAIYADETGGAPLWQETQYVTVDAEGRYAVLLGATQPEGLPVEMFSSGEAHWLGRRFERTGETEQRRVLLASVPYALKAQDAETLGGRPAAAYVLADSPRSTTSGEPAPSAMTGTQAQTFGTANYIGKFANSTDLVESSLYDAGGAVGLNTLTPRDIFHVTFMNTSGTMTGYAVQNLGNTATSYSGMLFYDQFGALGQFQGFNNVTHEYRINNIASSGSINFMLGSSSKFQVRADGDVDISGSIRKGGTRFLHNFGLFNTFLGLNAGNVTLTGSANTATGFNTLFSNTTGYDNTATGVSALYSNTIGGKNMASGTYALSSNTTGERNTASGDNALANNTTGNYNTASGHQALVSNTTGNYNTAIGWAANVSSGALQNATAIGSNAVVNASNKIRLGDTNVTVIEGQVAYTFTSDKTKKEQFQSVDAEAVLTKLRGVEVTSWNYIGQDATTFRHYGPMAQDFYAAFGQDGLGSVGTPTTMNSGDEAGILMLAVQALERRTAEQQAREAQLMQTVLEQQRRIDALERRVLDNTRSALPSHQQ